MQLIDRAVLVGRITLDNLVIVHDMFIKGSVYSSGSRTADLLAIRPAVWYTEYIYGQYTVALELRIFKDFVFNYIVGNKSTRVGFEPGTSNTSVECSNRQTKLQYTRHWKL